MRRVDPFLVLLIAAAGLATVLPATGDAFEVVRIASMVGIGLLFFLYGARLSAAETWHNLRNWRLQLTILSVTFAFFPVLGLGSRLIPDAVLVPELAAGLLLLTLMPSTVQGCVVYTRMARGNVAAAVVSASTSNLLGVFLTPLLVALLMGASASVDGNAVLRIVGQILAPFVAGQLLRPLVGGWVSRHDTGLKRFDRSTILLVVYVAFSEGATAGIWSAAPVGAFVLAAALCALLLAVAMGWCVLVGRVAGFPRGDRIALLFCGSNKSLASGLPMATVLFTGGDVALLILPLMLYHQLQLVVGSILAGRLGREPDPA